MRRPVLTAAFALLLSVPAWAGPSQDGPSPVKKAASKIDTGIQWKVAPETVEVFLDGKKVGIAKELDVTAVKPGKHAVRLVNGEDETEFEVNVKKGQLVPLQFEFTDE
jgi:hypothetical protein